jgi:hypothetical protein
MALITNKYKQLAIITFKDNTFRSLESSAINTSLTEALKQL